MPRATPMDTPPTGGSADTMPLPEVPEEGTADRTAAEDMVLIQMPRAQLQTVVEAFRSITSLLEDAAAKADTDISGTMPAAPGTMKPEETLENSPASLAQEIEGMRRARG